MVDPSLDPAESSTTADAPRRTGPLGRQGRITSLDVLRGVAVLAILVMNVQSFSMVGAAYLNPTAVGELVGLERAVWLFGHLFFSEKFISIFSMLFGAGILLVATRRDEAGLPSAGLHYRRMFALLIIGLLHAHLLWLGDILVPYALCGMVAYLFRRIRPAFLVVLALAAFAIPSLISLGAQATMPHWPPEQIETMRNEWWQPSPEKIAEEEATYRGSWIEQQPKRSEQALFLETQLFLMETAWRCGGLMLLGMALMKWGVFAAGLARSRYLILLIVGLALGLPLVVWGVTFNEAHGWALESSFFLGGEFNYWGAPVVALAWIGLVMLVCREGWLPGLQARLAAVGRTAFSCYLAQTLICTTLFYGHGFGLYGHVSRLGQLGITVAVWAMLLVVAPLWLRRYRFGPAEWLWRTMSYLKPAPMRIK